MARIKYYDSVAQEWAYADMAVAMPPSRLPSAYQEVEYIESDGTGQYIDTGVTYGNNTRVVVKESMNYNSAVFKVTGAAQTVSSYTGCIYYGHISENQGYYSVMFKSKSSTPTSADWAQTSVVTDGTVHILDLADGSQKIDDTEVATQTYAGTWQSTHNLYIFARNNFNDTASPIIEEKMYSYTIYNGSTVLRDFVPCYHKNTGAIGLFDTIEGKFYQNDGTGTFSKGADV